MKKRLAIIGCLIILLTILKVEYFPFGLPIEKSLPNTNISVYSKDVKIKSKNDFIIFLKNNTERYDLKIFKDSSNNINWDKVRESVKTGNIMWRKYYNLCYTPEYCNMYYIKITSNGHIYDYRSCGK